MGLDWFVGLIEMGLQETDLFFPFNFSTFMIILNLSRPLNFILSPFQWIGPLLRWIPHSADQDLVNNIRCHLLQYVHGFGHLNLHRTCSISWARYLILLGPSVMGNFICLSQNMWTYKCAFLHVFLIVPSQFFCVECSVRKCLLGKRACANTGI